VPKLILAQVSFTKEYFIVNQQHPQKIIKNGEKLFVCGAEYHNLNNHFNGFILTTNINGDSLNYLSTRDTISNSFNDILINDSLILVAGDRDSSKTYSDATFFVYSLVSNKKVARINFGDADGDIFLKILIDKSNNIYLIGWVVLTPLVDANVKVVKCKQDGTLVWGKNYGGVGQQGGYGAMFAENENLIICGTTNRYSIPSPISGQLENDGYLICIDTLGSVIWEKNYTINNLPTIAESFQSITSCKGNQFICSGYLNDETIIQNDPNYDYEALLYMVNDTGKVIWYKRFFIDTKLDKSKWYKSYFTKVIQDVAGNILLLGTYRDMNTFNIDKVGFLCKYNPEHDTIYWRIEFKELDHDFEANDFVLNDDGSVFVVLEKWPIPIYSSDVILVKIDNTGCLMDECHIGQPHFNTNGIVFPNPFTNEFNLQFTENVSEVNLSMYNAVGQLVASNTLKPKPTAEGNYYVNYQAPTLSKGLYFYQLTADGNIITKGKIMKQ
jgi:hypothetical protein